ncbi:MAG: hypothetical protein ACREX3_09575 [Gammaproteobacteria bacterium]
MPEEALRAAPPEVIANLGGPVLPSSAGPRTCRLCGVNAPLSREHLPPKSAGNKGQYITHGLEAWFTRDSLDDSSGGTPGQGGVWGYTLCKDCNNRTGRYATEYRGWAARAEQLLRDEMADSPETIDRSLTTKCLGVKFTKVDPGSFIRQVLSMMCSLSAGWDLAGRHPELRSIVLDAQPGELPAGMRLGMGFFPSSQSRTAGPYLNVDRDTRAWHWGLELAFPPFVLHMVLAEGGKNDFPLCDISTLSTLPPGRRCAIELEVIVAFGHTPYPTDYRTRAQIENGLTLYGPADSQRHAAS